MWKCDGYDLSCAQHNSPVMLSLEANNNTREIMWKDLWERQQACLYPLKPIYKYYWVGSEIETFSLSFQALVLCWLHYAVDILPSFWPLHLLANCACQYVANCNPPTDQVRTVLSLLVLSAKSAFGFKSCVILLQRYTQQNDMAGI